MGRAINSAEDRMMTNIKKIMDCTYPAGNVRMSKKTCQERYKASEKARIGSIGRGDLFTCAVGPGLLRCRSCPMVKGLSDKALEAPLSHMTNF